MKDTESAKHGLFGLVEDYKERSLSLDEKFLKHREAVFYLRAAGDSMAPEIKENDILIVDRSVPLVSGVIATFYYQGQAICKQYYKSAHGTVELHSYNPNYKIITIDNDEELILFGVVIGLARDL